MPEARTQTSHRLNDREIARVCYEVNRAYCQSLGDFSQPPWDDAPQWQKDSAVKGVEFHMEAVFQDGVPIDAMLYRGPEASHESWMAQKLAEGWTFGPVKDAEKKEHPCLVPFNLLPREQQAKDFIFRAVVHALAVIE